MPSKPANFSSGPQNPPASLLAMVPVRGDLVVTKLEKFCTPVGKGVSAPDVEENPEDPTTWAHLACYSVNELSGPELPTNVNVVDQFTGPDRVTQTVEKPRRWCEPALKADVTPR